MGKICGIYKITSPSNRIYIGQSRSIRQRFNSYKSNQKSNKLQIKLFNSFQKYGVENHIFEIVEECSILQLNIRERFWQDFYDCLKNGLNCILTATDTLPRITSDELKLKYRERSLGEKNPFFNKKHSDVTKRLQIESAKNRDITQEGEQIRRDSISSTLKGKSKSNSHIENIRKAKLGSNNPMFGFKWKLVDGKRLYYKGG